MCCFAAWFLFNGYYIIVISVIVFSIGTAYFILSCYNYIECIYNNNYYVGLESGKNSNGEQHT